MNKSSDMEKMWDERYADEGFAYGKNPNVFFKESLINLKLTGSIILPGEGEGRNAIYAAKQGLEVTAFDISIEGKNKAMAFAEEESVVINFEVGDFFNLDLINQSYDSAALIYAHFPSNLRAEYHKKITSLIKPGGTIILEGFSVSHLEYQKKNPQVGGPKMEPALFSKDMIKKDFEDLEIVQLEEQEIELSEGQFHNGVGKVIRFIGKKQKDE